MNTQTAQRTVGGYAVRRRVFTAITYIVAALLAVILMVPLAWTVSGALHTNQTLYQVPFQWFPNPPMFSNFIDTWRSGNFGRQALNSLIVATVISVVGVLFAQMAGYALAKMRFLGRDLIFWSIISTLSLPFPAVMIPIFVIARYLGIVNTYVGLIVPGLMTAQAVFFMRQYMLGLPDEVLASARVDGASEFRIYLHIVMPMAWPVMAAMIVLTFVGSWNNLLWPLIVVDSQQLFTLPIGLTQFNGQYFTNYIGQLCLSLVAIVPMVVLFLLVRRRLLDAIMVGGGAVTG